MFALRKGPAALRAPLASRCLSTAVQSPPTPEVPDVSPTSGGRRFRKKTPPKRPNITLENPRRWCRPLAFGVLPAYDTALVVLNKDSQALKDQAKTVRAQVDEKEAQYQQLSAKAKELEDKGSEDAVSVRGELSLLDEQLEKLLDKLHILEVQSEINLPEVRWSVNNAMADMSKLSHRYLMEQKWRRDGDLDLLMERVYQMKVVPDILPELHPTIDLHLVARTTPQEFLRTKKVQTEVEAGIFLKPKQTLLPPKLYATAFHSDVRLYTMLLVDLDVPNPETQGYTTFLHWMKPNIPLSATTPSRITELNDHTSYIPPHPQQGSPYHRYVCLLLPQPPLGPSDYTRALERRTASGPTSTQLDIPIVPDEERLGFNVRDFVSRWNLGGAKGGGVHMFREVWDETVSTIYKDVLQIAEPRYGRPPKEDVYAQLKQKRYIA